MKLQAWLASHTTQAGLVVVILGLILIAVGIALAQSLGVWKWGLFAGAEALLAIGFFLVAAQQKPQEG